MQYRLKSFIVLVRLLASDIKNGTLIWIHQRISKKRDGGGAARTV